jgi:hypothetical protein
MPRNFVSDLENENLRSHNEATIVRSNNNNDDQNKEDDDKETLFPSSVNTPSPDDAAAASGPESSSPASATTKNSSSTNSNKKKKSSRVQLPDDAQDSVEASSLSGWWKQTTKFAEAHKHELKIGIFGVVLVVALLLMASVATQSGTTPAAAMPRLLFFLVDGVTVKDFNAAASSRRVPSMNFFTQQSENCRPLVASGAADYNYFSNPFDRCVMPNPSTHVGTLYSLLTGSSAAGLANSVSIKIPTTTMAIADLVSLANFSTFLRSATRRGLSTAVFGNTPLLTVTNTDPDLANSTVLGTDKLCGILDAECAGSLTTLSSSSSASTLSFPSLCRVPATAAQDFSAMTTSSTNCNTKFQGLIQDSDTPDQIWDRVKYVLRQDADVLVIQIPETTVNAWQNNHKVSSSSSSTTTIDAINAEFSRDAALYDVDRLFSKVLRDVAVRSAEQGEEWMTFLGVASADSNQPQLLMASNVISNGVREDVDSLLDLSMTQLTPSALSSIIASWLSRK